MRKIDYKKSLKALYSASPHEPDFVDVPPLNYLTVDGTGDPNTAQSYQDAVAALFSLSYAIKFAVKKGPDPVDFGVMPLEGRWWMDDMTRFSVASKGEWRWSMMILQPEVVTSDLVKECTAAVAKKKALNALTLVRFESLAEGRAAQIMHVGPFADEGPTIARLHAHIAASGLKLAGKHHEIYLSDIRRAAPARWKTIIRQPVT
jgi:hypothetical protein